MASGIGETLRAARLEQGLTLADVADATRIRQRYLLGLEDESFETLGADVYARGFLRSYAQFLGLDPEPLLAAYRAASEPDPDTTVAIPETAPRERVALPPAARTIGAAAALVLLLAVVALAGNRPGGIAEAPPVAPATRATGAVATPPPAPATPAPSPAATHTPAPSPPGTGAPTVEQGVEVELRVEGGASWLRVVVDGEHALEGTLLPGVTRSFHGERDVVVRVGDAGNVRLVVAGEDLGVAGAPGEVRDYTFRPPDNGPPGG